MTEQAINLSQKPDFFSDLWSPKNVEHRPVADDEVQLLLIEPKGTPNAGDQDTAAIKTNLQVK